ncbi:MAG: M1 family metallopeptidase [Mycobacterium leprae]
MRKFRGAAVWLLLLFLVVACQRPPEPKVTLHWTGEALEGMAFTELPQGRIRLHYGGSTTREVAVGIATLTRDLYEEWVRWGRMDPPGQVDLWLVPAEAGWPAELAAPPYELAARAAGPDVVVMRVVDPGDAAEFKRTSGLPEALAVALTQQAGSPVYAVDWLHEGMGTAWSESWSGFPRTHWREGNRTVPYDANEMFTALTASRQGKAADARKAANALAALVMDRWGVNWPAQYARSTADLTPAAALRWATGGNTDADMVRLWQERMNYVVRYNATKLNLLNTSNAEYIPTAAEVSPIRVDPAPIRGQGSEPNDNYSPTTYELRASYDPTRRSVNGTERLTWQNGEGVPVDTLYFNLWPNAEQYAMYGGGIAVSTVQVDGKAVAYIARGLDLVVPLGRPVAPGEQVKVETQFTTALPARLTERVFGQDGENRFNLAHWFPILAVLDDRGWNLHPLPYYTGEPYSENSSFHVWLDVPAGTQVAATGHQVAAAASGQRVVYEYDAPNVKDWVATGGRGLVETDQVVDGVTIHAIDVNPVWTRAAAADTAKAVQLFSGRFGPYAYTDLVVTCCAGLEYPGLFYSMPQDPQQFWQVTTFHEAAHQWFFGMVGNDQYSEPWLDEGFARYGERLGVRAFGSSAWLRDLTTPSLPSGLHVSSSSADYGANPGNYYALGVYNKGALALEDLESLIGQEQFDRLMQEWVRQYKFKTATTADFIYLATQVSGRPLKEFFTQHGIYAADRGRYRPIMPLGQESPRL